MTLLAVGIEIGPLDLRREQLRIAVPDPSAQTALDLIVDHLRQAAELPPDHLGLAHQYVEYPVFCALRKHEVVAANLVRRLQFAVDPPIALFDSPGVPREVEVEQIGAVGLEVETLTRGIGRDAVSVADPSPDRC